jgi:hypothetical protein
MNSGLAEIWLEETCRKPTTPLLETWLEEPRRKPTIPAEIFRFCGRRKNHRPSRKDRVMAALGGALIALGQRVKPKDIAQTATPAYQGKK